MEAFRGHQKQMSIPLQLIPLNVKEQWLYSKFVPTDWASYPISKGAPSHPEEETHFGCVYLWSSLFSHYSKFMTIGASRSVDWPVNRELCYMANLSLFTITVWYTDHITAEDPPIHLSISRISFSSLVNKSLRYLNSSTRSEENYLILLAFLSC